MLLRLVPFTGSITEPIDVATARKICGLTKTDNADDNALMGVLATTARQVVERRTGIYLASRQEIGVRDSWPGVSTSGVVDISDFSALGVPDDDGSTPDDIEFPCRPVMSVDEVATLDTAGASSVWDASNYYLDNGGPLARIGLRSGASMGALQDRGGIRIKFTAGWPDASTQAADAMQAARLLIKHWFQYREVVSLGKNPNEVPFSVDVLLKSLTLKRMT